MDARDVDDYIKAAARGDFSAKDFRTWSATVLAAAALSSGTEAASPRGRRRAVSAAVTSVAERLGNTPAVCRSSYIDPRVIDRFQRGETVSDLLRDAPDLPDPGPRSSGRAAGRRRAVEEAVIQLLDRSPG